MIVESCVSGPAPLIADAISMVPHSTEAASNSDSSGGCSVCSAIQFSSESRMIFRRMNRRKFPLLSMRCGSHSPNM